MRRRAAVGAGSRAPPAWNRACYRVLFAVTRCPFGVARRERGLVSNSSGTRRGEMNNIFYIIGVIVVVLAILGYLGLR